MSHVSSFPSHHELATHHDGSFVSIHPTTPSDEQDSPTNNYIVHHQGNHLCDA